MSEPDSDGLYLYSNLRLLPDADHSSRIVGSAATPMDGQNPGFRHYPFTVQVNASESSFIRPVGPMLEPSVEERGDMLVVPRQCEDSAA